MIKAGAARLRALGPWRATLSLTLTVALLHLLAAGRVPLSADEAHYALYGLHLDWSYFDHPPLVGWLQTLVLFFTSSDFALRLWPIGLSAATSLVLFRFARRLFPGDSEWLAFWTVVFYQSGLLFQALGLALLPETPLLLFALLGMLALLNVLERERLADWLLFGLCIGLAGLSKYTAVTLVFSAALFVVLQRRLDVLRTPGPWLAMALALLLIAPVLYWNATHDWLSFRYQIEHGYRAKDWEWTRVGITQLAQFFAYAPGVYVFGLIALFAGLREWRERGVQMSLLLVLPVLLLFTSGSGREESLPHWTALAWAGSAPLAARWLLAHWARRPVRAFSYFSGGYSLALILLLHVLFLFPTLPFPGKHHPLAPLAGWPQAAQRATQLHAEFLREHPQAVLFVPNWSLASRLAWYARPLPVQVPDERFDQFDLWFGSPANTATGVLVAPDSALKALRRVRERFAHCEQRDPLPVYAGNTTVVTFHFYLCRGYRGSNTDPAAP
jgi:4-amino-4-deoxy-L-arabinose transferase-like glycosyltransferase